MAPDGEDAPCRPPDGRCATCITSAWQAAEADGTLPAVGDAERPAVEVAHPADPAHGDLATNLALKLARPMRRSPLAIAEVLAAALRTAATTPGGGPPLLAEVSAVAPGFVNVRLVTGLAGGGRRWRAGGRRPLRPAEPGPAAAGERGVRIGQPHGAAAHRQRARRVRGRPALSRPRGRRAPGHARVLLQRLRGPGPPPRRLRLRAAGGSAGARRGVPRRLRGRTRARGARDRPRGRRRPRCRCG